MMQKINQMKIINFIKIGENNKNKSNNMKNNLQKKC